MSETITATVREKKSASVKLFILQSALELIEKKSFEKVHVNDICESVGISKVTFFKYFPQKEDILLYYLRVWSFHRAVELQREPKKGVEGIKFLFSKLWQSYSKWPGMLLGAIGYYTRLDMPVRPFPLKTAEKKLLYPDSENIEQVDTLSIDQLFENFLLEAIMNKEITRSSNIRYLVQLLNVVLFGTVMTAHLKQVEHSKILFKNAVDYILHSMGYNEGAQLRVN